MPPPSNRVDRRSEWDTHSGVPTPNRRTDPQTSGRASRTGPHAASPGGRGQCPGGSNAALSPTAIHPAPIRDQDTLLRDEAEQDPIEADKKRREYQSHFASNIALSYRKEAVVAQEELPPAPAGALAKALPSRSYPYAVTGESPSSSVPGSFSSHSIPTAAPHEGVKTALTTREDKEGVESQFGKPKPENYSELNRADGKQYRLFEGTVLETVLTNRLDGSFSGPVNCMLTTNVYSHDGQRLLIAQGSRVLGEVRKVATFGDQRLAVFFHRLIMPDGYSVSLRQISGVKSDWRNRVGGSGQSPLFSSLRHFAGDRRDCRAVPSQYPVWRRRVRGGRLSAGCRHEPFAIFLADSRPLLECLPTFTIREGHRVKVYLSNDLLLPAYEKHQMTSDL